MSSSETTRDPWKYAEKAMSWYGWGSPVGLGLFLVGLGGAVVLLRLRVIFEGRLGERADQDLEKLRVDGARGPRR
jgi:hypothetical protein